MNPRTRKLKLAFDSHVAWRIAAFAEKENRSLTSAANHLVNQGWQAWSGDRWDQVAVVHAKPEPEPATSTSSPRNILFPLTMIDEMQRLARHEKRTLSSLVRAAVREYIDKHRIASINTAKADADAE